MKQLNELHGRFDQLQHKWGDINLKPIYGAGEINNPRVMFIFMNPTARNISSDPSWSGLRAPWLGTKLVWNIFNDLGFLNNDIFKRINTLKSIDWDINFANEVYSDIQNNSGYITNLAKCSQVDARPLSNSVFKEYLDLMYEEIEIIKPQRIVSFGNQVSSILLKKPISVSNYNDEEFEVLEIKNTFKVYPTYYPVGQGRRNLPNAISRLKKVI